MRRNLKDMAGQVFGNWKLLSLDKTPGKTKYLCECVCGNTKIINASDIVGEKTTSCGCKKTEKTKQTNIQRYGAEHCQQNDEIRQKTKQTNIQRYGTETPIASKTIKDRAKQTIISRYGVDNVFKNAEIQKQIKEKIFNIYGVDNISQDADTQQKRKNTFFVKFGVDNPSLNDDIKEKRSNTFLQKYGNKIFFSSQHFLDNFEKTHYNRSAAEKEILDYIVSLGFSAQRKRVGGIEIDIFIPELNIGIEYNGLYWHSEKKVDSRYHHRKRLIAKEHGIVLYQIFEHEWKSRKHQIKERLKSLLKVNCNKIGARKCQIRKIDKKQAQIFLRKNHIQGAGSFSVAYGLVFNENIVAIATISKHHRKSSGVVLSRFACKENTTVQGGLSKLSKYIHKNHGDMISWADLRWSDGNGYIEAGWSIEDIIKPDYFYTNGTKTFSKQSRAKKRQNTPAGMTEYEHAKKDGLYRVYDCGKIRFSYKKQ